MKKSVADKILAEVPETYDQISDHFSLTRKELWSELIPFRDRVLPSQMVLDAGCGNGRLMKLFEGFDCAYVGVDNSAKLLAKAQQASQAFPSLHPTFKKASLLSLPFPDATFDHIFCIAAFHHIPSIEYQKQAANELYRVLKPHGTLVMTNWNLRRQTKYVVQQLGLRFSQPSLFQGMSFFDFLIPWKSTEKTIYRYYRAFSKWGIENIVKESGFKNINSTFSGDAANPKRNICTTATKDLV